jgi:predicted transposase YbfD/YdcC
MTFPDPRPHFENIKDPRRESKLRLHKLGDILFILLSATICGVESITAIEEWAYVKEAWLRQYLELPNGIPSHDTINDILHRINSKAFSWMLTEWAETDLPSLAGLHIAVDGKTLRGSRTPKEAVHVVTAWVRQGQFVIAQEIVSEKSNEITAVPPLLTLVDIKGAAVTGDAMNCQKTIVELVHACGADYVFAVKDNQPKLFEDVQSMLDTRIAAGELKPFQTLDKGHGRVETRKYFLSRELDGIRNTKEWNGLAAIGMVESKREIVGKDKEPSVERRYFISTVVDLPKFAELVRGHWSIENQQHWTLDVQFREDEHQLRGNGAKNFAVIRRMSLNILRRDQEDKRSTTRRRMCAMLDDSYREALLFNSAVA